jgi:hypothetical protein
MLYTTIFAIAACLAGPLCAAMPSAQIHARSEGNNTLTLDAQTTAASFEAHSHVTRAEGADFDPPIHVSFYTYGKRVVVDGIYWADDTTYSDDEVNNDPDLVKFGSQSTYPGERDFWEFVGQMWQSKRLDHPRTFKWTPDSSKVLPITVCLVNYKP